MFISSANNEFYGDLKTELLNDYIKGVDNQPVSTDKVVQLLNTYRAMRRPRIKHTYSTKTAIVQSVDKSRGEKKAKR